MEAGYHDAWFLPIGFVYDEHNMLVARENHRYFTEAGLLQKAIATIFSRGGVRDFNRALRDLHVDVEPHKRKPPSEE